MFLTSTQSFIDACKTGIVSVVELLLEGGADPNQTDEVRQLMQHRCADCVGFHRMVCLLFTGPAAMDMMRW